MTSRVDPDAPIVPGVGLGGFHLGVHVQEVWEVLFEEYTATLLNNPDYYRWERKPWQSVDLFEARYEVPPVAFSIDVRDGIVFKLAAIAKGYSGTFEGYGWGVRVGDVLERPNSKWDDVGYVWFEDAPGIAFLQPESDPHPELVPHLWIDEIAVFLPERGLSTTINVWPPAAAMPDEVV